MTPPSSTHECYNHRISHRFGKVFVFRSNRRRQLSTTSIAYFALSIEFSFFLVFTWVLRELLKSTEPGTALRRTATNESCPVKMFTVLYVPHHVIRVQYWIEILLDSEPSLECIDFIIICNILKIFCVCKFIQFFFI